MPLERTRPAMHAVIAGMCALLLVVGTVPLIGATYAYGEEQPASKQQKEPEQSAQGDKEGVERSAAETIEAPAEALPVASGDEADGEAEVRSSNSSEVVEKELTIASHPGSWMFIPIRNVTDENGNVVERETSGQIGVSVDLGKVHSNGSGVMVDENVEIDEGAGQINNSENLPHCVRVVAPKDARGYSPSYANVVISDSNGDGAYDKAAISYVYPELVNVAVVNAQGQPVKACVRVGDATGGLPAPYVSHYWVYNGTPSLTVDKNGCFPVGCHLGGNKLVIDVAPADPLGSDQIEGFQIGAEYFAPDGVINDVKAYGSVHSDFAPTESGDLPVSGDAGVKVSGTLNGINVPMGAEASVNAIQLTSGASYEELASRAVNGVLAGIFEVNLIVNGTQVHDGFGSLAVTFPVDAKYNGHWVTVWHRHNDGSITSERVMAENGAVTVTVTDLSSFALEIGELAVSEGEGGEGEKAESSSEATPLAKTGDPLSWAAGLAGLALAALAACGAAAYSSRKVR